jgi:hypothetical protein
MKKLLKISAWAAALAAATLSGAEVQAQQKEANAKQQASPAANTLTAKEKKDGWKLLFDGQTTTGWRGANKKAFPEKGWEVENGELVVQASGGDDSRRGGDIVTTENYDNFELVFDFKLTPGANSGLKYFVAENHPQSPDFPIGLEYQVLDDEGHPDAKNGINGNRTLGSLYDLIPAQNKTAKPVGEWNQGRVVARGRHVEHWLNGTKIVEYERGSPGFRARVAESKFKKFENFGEAPAGPILIQDHHDRVAYRNLKIRRLPAS